MLHASHSLRSSSGLHAGTSSSSLPVVSGQCPYRQSRRSLNVVSRAVTTQQETELARAIPETQATVDEAFTPGMEGKARQVLFNRISTVYDEFNNTLSLGQHWVWKTMAVKWARVKPGQRVLDVCCGSGDIAFLMAQVVGPTGQVVGLDFAKDMLSDASRRQKTRQSDTPREKRTPMEWVQGDAMDLPFNDGEFDGATMGYGLRNVSDIPKALRELRRVIKPGSSVAILDFNHSPDPVTDTVQGFMLENVVVPFARQYGLEAEYAYLRPSIKRFPQGKEQERLALQAGFTRAIHYPVGFGLMGILVATR